MSLEQRRAKGERARERVAVWAHSGWRPAADRPDPVALLAAQNLTREPDLVPVRHGRMMVSPFTFYRGAAKIMAADLSSTPTAGLGAQLCGDAHLSNFGVYASPERTLVFDLPKSRFAQPGQRVVQGQRMMQAVSDIFLGWTKGAEESRSFYWRQLRDMKGSSDIESMRPAALAFYARVCGWTLARAHARYGDPVAIAEYLGRTDEFDRSVTDFSVRYADQNERDFEDFIKAIRSGRLDALEGV